jgi:CelD/BcsL family acetyltransferase involved in cellulose biosynthesis
MNAPLAHNETLDALPFHTAGSLRLYIHHDLLNLEHRWRAFESNAITTAYQAYDWCSLWLAHVGTELGIKPIIVVAENIFGETQFILPLQQRKSFGLTVIEALTAPLGAYAFGLFKSQFYAEQADTWFAQHLATIVSILPKHHVLRLADIVETVSGHSNPLLSSGAMRAANDCHIINLASDFDSFYEAKRPGRRRRYLRNRDTKLEDMGALKFTLPAQDDDIRTVMKTMFSDQEQRLAELGIRNVFTRNEKEFFTALALCESGLGRFLQPFALTLDNHTLATISGLYFNKTFWALISSLATHEARKHSPGDYALRHVFKVMCERKAKRYDFSVGHADYKEQWSDQRLQLYFILRARTLPGLVLAMIMLSKEKLKRFVKTSPWAFDMVALARRGLRGKPM